ncbi:MAG: type III-A CRISPR-associated RAMP protein Csm4 [Bacteroidetes bacterium]|nr:type III-A CRISPR-associated RAMP protein Csm4 [Bacteroidota bacterium]
MAVHKFSLYSLRFRAPVHFGDAMDDYGRSLGTYHSDSMYAALTAALAAVGTDMSESIQESFTISSLFPFVKASDDSVIHYFPKPLLFNEMPKERLAEHKKLKKITWVDQYYFEQLLEGKSLYRIADEAHIREGGFLSVREPKTAPYARWVAARVQVPRYSPDHDEQAQPRPFYMERIMFDSDAGLYFLAMGQPESLSLLEKGLEVLKDAGLGTDRNVGNGQFEWSKAELSLNLPESDCLMSLGLYIPEEELVTDKIMASRLMGFRIIRRGGWITTPPAITSRKNDIHAFDLGTVLKHKTADRPLVLGRIADLTPKADFIRQQLQHRIYRNGKTIFVPIKNQSSWV